MVRMFLAGIFMVLISSGSASGQVAKLYPIDEAHEDSSFISFRLHLLEAIAKRDTAFIYSHLAADVLNSFGGAGGVEEFKEYWKPASPETELWSVLARVAGGGGTFNNNIYSAPYYSAAFPAGEFNAFDYGAVVGEKVNVYAESRPDAKVIDYLSFDIVQVLDLFPQMNQADEIPSGWVQIGLKDGQKGFVSEKYIGSAIDYRARFEKRNEHWVIVSLVAGD